jgi:hypothetical protein
VIGDALIFKLPVHPSDGLVVFLRSRLQDWEVGLKPLPPFRPSSDEDEESMPLDLDRRWHEKGRGGMAEAEMLSLVCLFSCVGVI